MRAWARLAPAALAGALLGAAIAGVWWLGVDARTCLGGSCNGTSPGDLTVYVGALGGATLGLVVWLFWRFTRRG